MSNVIHFNFRKPSFSELMLRRNNLVAQLRNLVTRHGVNAVYSTQFEELHREITMIDATEWEGSHARVS